MSLSLYNNVSKSQCLFTATTSPNDRITVKPCLHITVSLFHHGIRQDSPCATFHMAYFAIVRLSYHAADNSPPGHHHRVPLHTYYTFPLCMVSYHTLTPRRTWHTLPPYDRFITPLTQLAIITPCHHAPGTPLHQTSVPSHSWHTLPPYERAITTLTHRASTPFATISRFHHHVPIRPVIPYGLSARQSLAL